VAGSVAKILHVTIAPAHAALLVKAAGVLEVGGAVAVLAGAEMVGAAVLALLLVSFNALLHNPAFAAKAKFEEEMISFLKNTSMIGGCLLLIATAGGKKAKTRTH